MINVDPSPLTNARACINDARKALRRASSRSLALDSLTHVLAALDALEIAERDLVAAGREQGATWEQVGHVYGVTRQAARQRFVTPHE